MKIVLSIGFNVKSQCLIPLERCYFKIKDPGVVPTNNDYFTCDWPDFILDENILKLLYEHDAAHGFWKVKVLHKDYSKKKVIINISLCEF